MLIVASEVGDLETAAERFKNAETEREQARSELHAEILTAARAGVRQVEIARISGYTRERIRQICRDAGIEAE